MAMGYFVEAHEDVTGEKLSLEWQEVQSYNSLLEVVCFIQEEFDQNGGALVRQIKKEGISTTPAVCHSEEQSDEESRFCRALF